jgi:uncharacterized protein with HEPN domain
MRDDSERLKDILKAIDHILSKTAGDRSASERDEMLQVWVIHHLQIVGEAARSLSSEFRQRHPGEVWAKAVGMRNILVHHYFEINVNRLWSVVEEDLSALRERIELLLRQET